MKRYITLCFLWGCVMALWGQSGGEYGGDYDPANPANPSEPSVTMKYCFKVTVSAGGSVYCYPSSTGKFVAGTSISLNANPYTGYKFLNWTIGDSIISMSQWHSFTMPAHDVEVKATFHFDPDVPDNPDVVPLTYKVTAEASPSQAGSVGYDHNEISVGTYTYVSASSYMGYQFKGWMLDGNVVSTEPYYRFEMGDKHVHFIALFEYNPTVPDNPNNNPDNSGTYTLSYVADGIVHHTEQLSAGATLTTVKKPTKRGYTFNGWQNVPTTMPAKDLTIEGSFTINKYPIAFVIEDDTIHAAKVEYNAVLIAPVVAEREGYTLVWNDLPAHMPDATLVVTGSYVLNKYKLTYLLDGENFSYAEVLYGTPLLPKAAPIKEGHTFSGWSEVPETMPAHDVVIEGSFTVNRYRLTYMLDSEEYSVDSIAYGTELVQKEALTKEGHTFSGWSEVPATMPAQNVTVTGSFTVNSYRLVYLLDGAEYSVDSVAYGTELVQKDALVKEGYTFSGWSEIPETMPAQNVTVEGTFTINRYTLLYMVDGAEYKTVELEYGTSIIAEAVPAKEGHTFSGWSEIPATMPAQDVTVEGSFTVNSYRLVYLLDGAEYSVDSIAYGTELVQKEALTKEGHTFSGWGEIPAMMPAKDVTVEGTFTINRYKVTYMVDGEEYASDSITYGEAIVLKDTPVKDGYIFSGWSEVPETMPAQDVTVTGSFTVNGIDAVFSDKFVDVYTLQGTLIKRQIAVEELEHELPTGIYIVNGKKMLVR